ncbi:4696_t:CDS:2 [Acaulospora colombiana]|uniref:4696_t:CDS:1 n=1 Tax=Acaulospora colombiana TaxID=27376 RepID=A0ACA9M6P7_9GLOM|nr:4696_t:CDS:2 [Acaulospora colombiana]
MADIEMHMGDNASDPHRGNYDRDDAMKMEPEEEKVAEESEEESSGAEDQTHEEELEQEDPEALVEIDPAAVVPERIRPQPRVDYTTPEAIEKAGLTGVPENPQEYEDGEYVSPEPVENVAAEDEDHSMQQ